MRIEAVAPVARVRQHRQHRLAERAGKVGDRGVAGHDDIEVGDDRRGVVETPDLAIQVDEVRRQFVARELVAARALLQREEACAAHVQQAAHRVESRRALAAVAQRRIAGPHEPDGELQAAPVAQRAKAIAPLPCLRHICMQVGRVHVRGRKSQHVRQAHQRDMRVERGRFVAASDNRLDARQARRESLQSVHDFQHHPSAAPSHLGHEAQELQRIAKALFGPDEDRPTCQRAAVPHRLRADTRPGLAAPEAPFVLAKALLETARA